MSLDSRSVRNKTPRQCKNKRRIILLSTLGLCALSIYPAHSIGQKSSKIPERETPLASMAGRSIYERDLSNAAQGELEELRQREYQVKREAVEAVLDRELVEIEAARLALTPDQLLQSDPDRASLLRRLRKQENVSIFLTPYRTTVAYDPLRMKGDPKAPVTIVEFGDFECPFCRKMEPTLGALLTEYRGDIKLAYRDFPLRQLHPHAQLAAEASRCAAEQRKFWEFHDLLFAQADASNRQRLMLLAEALKLDPHRFEECLNAGKYISQVEQDLQEGVRSGVSGTPTFFIDGIYLGGAHPASSFEEIINSELGGSTSDHNTSAGGWSILYSPKRF